LLGVWLILVHLADAVALEIPIVPELQRVIDASSCGHLTFLVTEFGRPFTAAGFGNAFRKRCDEAELENCSAHGLRKAAAAKLAELGATEMEIGAVTGHSTSKEISRYTRAARQKILAERAMAKLSADQKANKSVPLKGRKAEGGTQIGAKWLSDQAPAVNVVPRGGSCHFYISMGCFPNPAPNVPLFSIGFYQRFPNRAI
jgi:hypothetical protein